MKEFKSCPFCNCEVERITSSCGDYFNNNHSSKCPLCGIPICVDKNWNSRPIENSLFTRIIKLEKALKEIIKIKAGIYDLVGRIYSIECSYCIKMHSIAKEALKRVGK